ncbi:DUF4349 domain-containing protein [Pedobacter sp. MR22-3]|uniref:DUF4349 domain-containing protein n=1 Tax=Pedobacter sp. MR22-3 TaxID=2994552 RepID=UPI0022476994|nr:DUF4349 domain-containing protein [Pedobacter sp. MR22-3]MCX2586021.1 DUF4349 domain-containing protein [Pedobacter sp. MR22-3]
MKRNIIAIAIILTIFGCNNANKNDQNVEAKESIMAVDSVATVAEPKIIKTADMRFRVKNVQNIKEQLSQTIKAQGGTVAEFSIESIIQETQKVKQSVDSLKEITSYRTEGYLVANVPAEKLDDFTNTVAKMAVFVDNQSLKLDDQSLAYLGNRMKAGNRIEAANQMNKVAGRKSTSVETSLNIKDDYVDKKLQNLSIDNRVKYSTITLQFYQDNTIKTTVVANDDIYDYKPAFGNRLWMGIINGWTIFKELIIGLANIWALILTGVAIFFLIRYFIRKDKIKTQASGSLTDNRI